MAFIDTLAVGNELSSRFEEFLNPSEPKKGSFSLQPEDYFGELPPAITPSLHNEVFKRIEAQRAEAEKTAVAEDKKLAFLHGLLGITS